MKVFIPHLFAVTATLLFKSVAVAQIPVELFMGHKKASADIMFFKYFKNKDGENSKFLFFNRNRAIIDYAMTKSSNLPQFGFTEAISYNHEKLKGFAPVAVVGIFNSGIFPKAGIQYARLKKKYLVFTWLVAETMREPNIDFFILARHTPKLSNKIDLLYQIELINTVTTSGQKNNAFTERFRLGLKLKEFQFGAGLDLTQTGKNNFTTTENAGGFLRYEF